MVSILCSNTEPCVHPRAGGSRGTLTSVVHAYQEAFLAPQTSKEV